MKDAPRLLRTFCDAFWGARDAKGALALLAEDARWVGFPGCEDVCDAAQLKHRMETDVAAHPLPCALSYAQENRARTEPETDYLRLTARRAEEAFSLRVSAVIRTAEGAPKICFIHTSPAADDCGIVLEQDQELTRQSGAGFSSAARSRSAGALEVRQAESDAAAGEKTSRAVAEVPGIALDELVRNVPCGLCLCRWDGAALSPIFANQALTDLWGEDALAHPGAVGDFPYAHAHPEDLPGLRAALRAGLDEARAIDHTYRSRDLATGLYRWLRLRGVPTRQADGSTRVYLSFVDVTGEHDTARKLRESEKTLEYAAEHAGLWYWRYDAKNGRIWPDVRHQRDFDLPPVLGDYPESWLRLGVIHPDYCEAYRQACRRVAAGEKRVVLEARAYLSDRDLHWMRLCFTNLADQDGIAVCTALLIDAEKELQIKYELERKKPAMGEGNLLVHALFNLTRGETLEYAYRDGRAVPLGERTVFSDGTTNVELLIDPEEQRRFTEINDVEKLLQRYAEGEAEHTLDYRRILPGGEIIWVRNILHLVRDPASADTLLFEYCYDVEEEITQERMCRSLATDNYDYVVRIDGRSGRFAALSGHPQDDDQPPSGGGDIDAVARRLIATCVMPEDREMMLENVTLANIKRHLAQAERFRFSCRELAADGAISHKKFTQYYLDRQREVIVMIREDVTQVVQAEARKNELLASALAAANQASRAKSQFLSRMSHELRTPMNAIIGLSALAAADVNNPRAMEDNIGKIGMSARYLLSLINDILEMSRIESGRMTLNEGPFDFEQLISSVNNIIYGQAGNKGVDYDAIARGFTETSYVGDATKLQQVLINVLGNSVKFTPAGGKITLTIEQVRRSSNRATLRFVVSDTGVGIDTEFLPHLFEPFSQEESSVTATSAGTGLGLAITKSMVEMMNGHIHVQSLKNIGSVFTIEVQLGVSPESRRQMDLLASMNLSRLRALVVDDDVVVCQTTENILSTMGMQVEWVDSGILAVERVGKYHAQKCDFDTIFIDWKMPDMDGIETTRQIRRIVGPDVTIIIMTAYDWKHIEAQAREAGVDMFMEKPLFQSSIVNAFEKIFTAHKSKIEVKPKARYDFTGRRILLAEDHPLNVEVAKRILERVGAEVVLAVNGLEALEAFTTAENYYYDAILMDIRMPVMDGLTAAKNIRNLKKEGSKSIPIVAMTANAFDEDVELSLSHGMDAHLIKPIDPQLMYATLQRLMKA